MRTGTVSIGSSYASIDCSGAKFLILGAVQTNAFGSVAIVDLRKGTYKVSNGNTQYYPLEIQINGTTVNVKVNSSTSARTNGYILY